jgi:hypothetical protein
MGVCVQDSSNDSTGNSGKGGLSTKWAEIIVGVVIFLLGSLVIVDSVRVGIGWAPDGPRAGYFPFYIGLFLCMCSAWVVLTTFFSKKPDTSAFVSPEKFKLVLSVLFPAMVFVIAIYFIGIYIASAFFIGIFMRWLGKFGLAKILPVSLLTPIIMFLLFEIWFLVPLPKGPVEAMFGY